MSLGWVSCSVKKKACVGWIERYFKDCVCNPSGEISFALGLVSLVCWGVAEIPQIITNFHTKSAHGVSLAFLLTWVVGDLFNMVGCLLEPVTLPTQYYTALLYTVSTVVLVLQTIYYEYIRGRWGKRRDFLEDKIGVEEGKIPLINPSIEDGEDSTRPIPTATNQALRTPLASPRADVYYTSARSLASSGTPTSYYLGTGRSGPSGGSLHQGSSSDDDNEEDNAPVAHRRPSARPNRTASRSVGYGTFLVGSISLPFQGKALTEVHMFLSGKTSLQETMMNDLESNTYGVLLGWIMASIYIGGRLPQIYLNIKRGSVDGLNPFMFLFALIANGAYVGSILVRSTEWTRIKANLPWLLDAIVCVLLDIFIILQYAYYKLMHRRVASHEADYGIHKDVKKPFV